MPHVGPSWLCNRMVPRARTTLVRIPCLGLVRQNNGPKDVHILTPNPVKMSPYQQKELCRWDQVKDLELRRLFWATRVVQCDHNVLIRGRQKVQSEREKSVGWQKQKLE